MIKLKCDYSKKLGLPGYSSHQFSISLETEITDVSQVEAESARLYKLLQEGVDSSIQETGYLPSEPKANGNGNGNGHPRVVRPVEDPWKCSVAQKELILKITDENKLDKTKVDQLAQDRFGKGVKLLNKLEASGQPELVAQYWRDNIPKADWYDPMKEALVVLVLNTRKRIIGHNLVALGSLDTCPVTPLHIFRPVIAVAGASIILVHHHPSGDATPSEADIKVTRDLIRAGQLLKIEVLDHVVMGSGNEYRSLKGLGYFF